jgi:hypothetical protein
VKLEREKQYMVSLKGEKSIEFLETGKVFVVWLGYQM